MIDRIDLARLSPHEAVVAIMEATRIDAATPIPERVAAGALLLDAQRPGWERDVDLKTLDLADGSVCVLGQLYGDYTKGQHVYGFDRGPDKVDDALFGFAVTDAEDDEDWRNEDARTWKRLTMAWAGQIRARRAVAP